MKLEASLIDAPLHESNLGRIARFTKGADFGPSNIAEPLGSDSERNINIVRHCYQYKHMSVFEFAMLMFKINCPIAIARQLMRHRNGVFMERSLRALAPSVISEADSNPDNGYDANYNDSVANYKTYRAIGEPAERARFVLTLATPTSFLWKLSLRSLLNVFDQRLHKHAQTETRIVVSQMFVETKLHYPTVIEEWTAAHPDAVIEA